MVLTFAASAAMTSFLWMVKAGIKLVAHSKLSCKLQEVARQGRGKALLDRKGRAARRVACAAFTVPGGFCRCCARQRRTLHSPLSQVWESLGQMHDKLQGAFVLQRGCGWHGTGGRLARGCVCWEGPLPPGHTRSKQRKHKQAWPTRTRSCG